MIAQSSFFSFFLYHKVANVKIARHITSAPAVISRRILLVFLYLCLVVVVDAQPLFPCSKRLQSPYGICSHISRPGADYSLRDQDLSKMKEARITWVRSDFDWHSVMKDNDTVTDPAVFDATLQSCGEKGVNFLPILDRGNGKQRSWENPDAYLKYVHYLVQHYRDRLTYWEVINEANLLRSDRKEELGRTYAGILKRVYQEIKQTNPAATVVYGGQSELDDRFLEGVCSQDGQDYFDVMNFHSYKSPEDLILSYRHLADIMRQYGWSKPVWVTETGFSTPPSASGSGDFLQKVVPEALKKVGKNASRCRLGVVYDADSHLPFSAGEINAASATYKEVKYLQLKDLKNLRPSQVPLLIPSCGEFFPEEYMDDVVDYVRRGGTLICPHGVPFYYDRWEKDRYVHHGGDHQARLHLDFMYWWNEDAKSCNAPEIPSWQHSASALPFPYGWTFSKNHSARYLTARKLKDGDTMIPLVEAGNDNYKGCVAALYKLRSDLKGNIVIQTRQDGVDRSEDMQAKRLARAYLISFAYGVDRVFWYHLRAFETSDTDWEAHFGILHHDFTEKPAFQAYRTLTELCPDGSARPVLQLRDNIYQVYWQRPDGKFAAALWTTGPAFSVSVSVGGMLEITDYLGRRRSCSKKKVTLNDGVTYVVSSEKVAAVNLR